jgi:hypothetical protein
MLASSAALRVVVVGIYLAILVNLLTTIRIALYTTLLQ